MTKKEIERIEINKRQALRKIAKEKRDAEKAEISHLFAIKKQFWAQQKLEKTEKSRLFAIKMQLSTQRKLDKIIKDLYDADRKKLIYQRQHEKAFSDQQKLINDIKQNISRGDDNEIIGKSLFKGIRHFSYDLSQNDNYSLNKLLGIPKQGKTPEHVNGRTNVGVYCIWLMLKGEINTWEEFYKYLLKYACTLHTTPEFNRSIEKFQNNEAAITPEIYIREYEKEFNCKFTEEQKTKFSDQFLSTHYEKVIRNTVIDIIRNIK